MTSKFVAKVKLANLAIELRDEFELTVFIETGTLAGETTRWASGHFSVVYTIEKYPVAARDAAKRLADCGNVTVVAGDSRHKLPEILREIEDARALLWLDAHLTGPNSIDECALREELNILASCQTQHCILIDDAGWFIYGKPPDATNPQQWPDYKEIKKILKTWDLELISGINVISGIPRIP